MKTEEPPETRPRTSYLVCGTPRSGSSLLCEALKNTGLAGVPEEYFWRDDEPSWSERWGVSSYADYVCAAMAHGTTPNGVFGTKVMWGYMDDFLDKLRRISGGGDVPTHELLAATFPGLRYVWITRRDKVRQAVSFARAIQTGVWARTSDEPPVPEREPEFRFDMIDNLVRELLEHDAAWWRYFAEGGIEPLRITHEDFVPAYEATALRVLGYLGVPVPEDPRFGERRLERQADAVSEKWTQRYHALKNAGAG